MLSKTLGYEFRVLYMSGKLNLIADALSRSPVFAAEKDDPDLVCTVRAAKLDKKLAQHANRGGMRQESKKKHHDRSAVELEQLEVGCQVVVQDPKTNEWSSKGMIIGKREIDIKFVHAKVVT